MNKLIVNLATNEQMVVPLTKEEEVVALQRAEEYLQIQLNLDKFRRKQELFELLLEKIIEDPTILDRIK